MTGILKRARLAAGALLITAAAAAAVAAGTAGQALAPAAMAAPLVQGTDVSNLTTVSSWPAVKAAGMTFTGVMAYDGASVGNPHYNAEVAGALSAGLFVMPYVLADPLKISGTDEFDKRAWPTIRGVAGVPYAPGGKYLPIALDLEPQPKVTTEACYGLSVPQMLSWIKAFISAARALHGMPVPVIYTTAAWWKQCTASSTAFGADPLWVAAYRVSMPALPAGWDGYTFWQSSGSATVNGIAGTSDSDLDQLEGIVAGKAGVPGTFQVQTLTSLAGLHVSYGAARLPKGVTVSSSGKLSWSRTTPVGAFPITVNAAGPAVPAAVSLALRLHGVVSVLTAPRSSTAGEMVRLQVSTSGPDQRVGFPAALAAAGLPPGLSMTAGGLITGRPTKAGHYTVKVGASDTLGGTGAATFPWTIK